MKIDWSQVVPLLIALLSVPSAYLAARKAISNMHEHSRFSELESRMSRTEDAVQAVLHDSLYKQCTRAIARNYVTVSELDNIEHLYSGYRGVGGNGTGELLYQKVQQLQVVNDTEFLETGKGRS